MRKGTKLYIIVTSFCMLLVTIGAAFATNAPKLNVDDRPVYKKCNIADIANSVDKDYKKIAEKYKARDIVACGVIKSIEKNKKNLIIKFDTKEIKVSTASKEDASNLSSGDNVTVFGKILFESEKKKTISIKADHLRKESITLNYDYYIYEGKEYKDSDSTEVGLADDRIIYRIPNSWIATEVAVGDYEKIFNGAIVSNGNAKCYYIDIVNGEKEPEIFSIFYFDKNLFLKNNGDKEKTHDIEKAIIYNICPEEETKFLKPSTWKIVFPTNTSATSNGIELDHYVGSYDNYRVEFAFAQVAGKEINDSGGICVMMHMYNNDSIKPDDALYVLNSLEIK